MLIETLSEVSGFVWAGIGIVILFALYQLRAFTDQITYSFQFLEKKDDEMQLLLRTPVSEPKADLLPGNIFFRIALAWAMLKCRKDDAFIRMSKRDMDVFQPAIINGLSAAFADGLLAKKAGLPVITIPLWVSAVFEKHGSNRNRKIRVIALDREDLDTYVKPMNDLGFERNHHSDRLDTSREMARLWHKEEQDPNAPVKMVRYVEVYLRV